MERRRWSGKGALLHIPSGISHVVVLVSLSAAEDDNDGKAAGEGAVELRTYRGPEEFPKDLVKTQVRVDLNKEAVIVPINGQPVPFHVSLIKNMVLPDPDTRATYLRINFYTPGTGVRCGWERVCAVLSFAVICDAVCC